MMPVVSLSGVTESSVIESVQLSLTLLSLIGTFFSLGSPFTSFSFCLLCIVSHHSETGLRSITDKTGKWHHGKMPGTGFIQRLTGLS